MNRVDGIRAVNELPAIVEQEPNCCSTLARRVASAVAQALTFVILAVYYTLTISCQIVAGIANILFTATIGEIADGNPVAPLNEDVQELLPEPLLVETPISAEEMTKRQESALKRLKEIKDQAPPFNLDPYVLRFDLEASLNGYSDNHETTKLLEHFTYADPGIMYGFKNKRHAFENFLDKYNHCDEGAEPRVYAIQKAVKTSLSKLYDIFAQKKARVKGNPEQEKALKQQIRYCITRLIDANNNCIDQVLAQLEHILLESISSETKKGAATPQEQIRTQAAALIFQYKSNLITSTCQNLYPKELHCADLERMVKQRVAPLMQIESAINNAGAKYDFFRDDKINPAQNAVLRRYNNDPTLLEDGEKDLWKGLDERPIEYLKRETIAAEISGQATHLRNNLISWAIKHFGLEQEDNETVLQILKEASKDPEMDFSMGGDLSLPGLLFLLEESGIVQQGN